MHPAYSVILFTTASGAGYGLIAWLAGLMLFGKLGEDRWVCLAGLVLGLALVTAGLVSSTLHLGRPMRAWRAFSQWRTSWLSREGVAAVATYVPAVGLVLAVAVHGGTGPVVGLLAGLSLILALVTVICTGMIYQSLTTISAWSVALVTPVYVLLAFATGGVLAVALLAAFGHWSAKLAIMVAGVLSISAVAKLRYWRIIDAQAPLASTGKATGLDRFGRVRPLEPPHWGANFLMREMGYSVARRHSRALRRLVLIAGLAAPAAALLLFALAAPSALALMLTIVALLLCAVGVLAERWLFFAEARHVVMAYYKPDDAR